MKSLGRRLGFTARLVGVVGIAIAASQNAHAGFVDFIIRGTPTIIHNVGDTEFVITGAGSKAALGSNDVNGRTLGDIGSLSIDRFDDRTRFGAATGSYNAPYLNFWITDGLGNFAVAANASQPLYNDGYHMGAADLGGLDVWIYENSDKTWLPNNGVGLKFSDLSAFVILAPTVAQFTTGWSGLTGGAPRELGSNVAYGVNWVFGDTLANYVSGSDGYIVANANVGVVPEPGTYAMMFAGLGALGIVSRRRRS